MGSVVFILLDMATMKTSRTDLPKVVGHCWNFCHLQYLTTISELYSIQKKKAGAINVHLLSSSEHNTHISLII